MALIVWATLLPIWGMPAERIPPAWCLRCGALWLADAIANVALFVPLGLGLAMSRWRVWHVAVASLVMSATVEMLQSVGFPPGRSAALADIVTNTMGGTLGAIVGLIAREERARTTAAATKLATAWTLLSVAVFTVSAQAMAPRGAATPGTRLTMYASPFEHVPGHGWFAGTTDSAAISDTVVRRGSTGPIILAAGADVLPVQATVWVRGTDPFDRKTPLLFVHQRGDSAAWLQIAKRSDDAELTVARTAWTWGLAFPSVVVPGVFRGRPTRDSSTVALSARVTTATLTLQHGSTSQTLRLTPLLGWSLIQPIITVQSRWARFAEWCWVLFWLAPITWWSRRTVHPMALAAALSMAIGVCLRALPGAFGIAALNVTEWLAVTGALACGVILAAAFPSSQCISRAIERSR